MNGASDIAAAFAAPFPPAVVKFKPQGVKNNRALALAYLDCRAVQDRLDQVVGVENWSDDYDLLPDGSVLCRLRVKLGGEWVTKVDVGSPSEQPDGGDRLKAAFSDALKRAAVKFGIGRYLYRLKATWADYDPVKKQFAGTPSLPSWALPPHRPAATPAPTPVVGTASHVLPNNGVELKRRLAEFDAKLAAEKGCPSGLLLSHVVQEGRKAGYAEDLQAWSGPAIRFAAATVKSFISSLDAADAGPKNAA